MAYANRDDLAGALRVRVTSQNTALLEACLDAAAQEIDDVLDRVTPLPDPAPARVQRVNVNRAVEWFKAADTANGGVGFAETGTLPVPTSGFDRHRASILGLKQQWGLG